MATGVHQASDPIDDMFAGTDVVVGYFVPFLIALALLAGAVGLVAAAWYNRGSGGITGWLVAGGGCLAGAIIAFAVGYVRLDAAVRPYGLTAMAVIVAVVVAGAIFASSSDR